jgi:hypothetical protein
MFSIVIRVLYFSWCLICFLRKFYVFCVFLSFDLFRFKYLFWFNFGFLVFGSVNGWTSVFGSTRTSQYHFKYLRFYLVCHCFDKMNFSWRACLANTSLDLFWQFCFFLNMVLCNDPKKKNNSCKNNKKLFLLIAYYSIRITNCIFYKKEKKVFFSMVLENNCIDFPLQFFYLYKVCKILYGFDQYFIKFKNFNSWKLMVNILV